MRGHIRKRGKGSWAVILDHGVDGSGRRRQRWHTVRGTKKDAERELAKLLHDMNIGNYVEPSKMSVGEYLHKWLDDYARSNVSNKTYERYAEIVHNHLVPGLGKIRLNQLQPLQIQDLYAGALADGRVDGKGGLSARTVLHHHRVLRAALQQALRWQLLVRNPADAVVPPKAVFKSMAALDQAETVRLLAAVKRSKLHGPIFIAVTTGLRRGELLALRWKNVDLDKATISVVESLEQSRQGLRFKSPKTRRGRRRIDLPQIAVDVLRRLKLEQSHQKLQLGAIYQDEDLVFAEPDGTPWAPNKLSSSFASLLQRAGFKGLRFHDLRHTHATQLLTQGVHPKVVSERLGHATIAITLDTYSHVLPGLQKEAIDQFDQSFQRAMAGQEKSR